MDLSHKNVRVNLAQFSTFIDFFSLNRNLSLHYARTFNLFLVESGVSFETPLSVDYLGSSASFEGSDLGPYSDSFSLQKHFTCCYLKKLLVYTF